MAQSAKPSPRRKRARSTKPARAAKPSAGSGGSKRRAGASPARTAAGKSPTSTLGNVARKARGPALVAGATVAAAAGGALLKRQLTPKHRKVLGVRVPTPHLDGLVPSNGLDLKPIAKGISQAGKRVRKTSRQLAKLSDDVEQVGRTAQKVGDSLS